MEIIKGPGMGIRALGLGTVEGSVVGVFKGPGMEIVEAPGMGIIKGPGIKSLSWNIGLTRCFLGFGSGPSSVSLFRFDLTTPGRFLS